MLTERHRRKVMFARRSVGRLGSRSTPAIGVTRPVPLGNAFENSQSSASRSTASITLMPFRYGRSNTQPLSTSPTAPRA